MLGAPSPSRDIFEALGRQDTMSNPENKNEPKDDEKIETKLEIDDDDDDIELDIKADVKIGASTWPAIVKA